MSELSRPFTSPLLASSSHLVCTWWAWQSSRAGAEEENCRFKRNRRTTPSPSKPPASESLPGQKLLLMLATALIAVLHISFSHAQKYREWDPFTLMALNPSDEDFVIFVSHMSTYYKICILYIFYSYYIYTYNLNVFFHSLFFFKLKSSWVRIRFCFFFFFL